MLHAPQTETWAFLPAAQKLCPAACSSSRAMWRTSCAPPWAQAQGGWAGLAHSPQGTRPPCPAALSRLGLRRPPMCSGAPSAGPCLRPGLRLRLLPHHHRSNSEAPEIGRHRLVLCLVHSAGADVCSAGWPACRRECSILFDHVAWHTVVWSDALEWGCSGACWLCCERSAPPSKSSCPPAPACTLSSVQCRSQQRSLQDSTWPDIGAVHGQADPERLHAEAQC